MSVYCKNHSDYSGAGCGQYSQFLVLILADHKVTNCSGIKLPTKERHKMSQSLVFRIKNVIPTSIYFIFSGHLTDLKVTKIC
jgi:hypothetical protein